MKINYSGESSRAEYEETEAKRDSTLAEVEALREERDSIEEEHRELREEFASEEPGTPYPLVEEETKSLAELDDRIEPLEISLHSTEKQLERLFNKAWDEALSEEAKREITTEILPKISKECATIHEELEKVEDRGHWLVRRADEIEDEIKKLLEKDFHIEDSRKIIELVKEFWEIRQKMASVHHAALGWNIRERKD